MVRLKKKNSDCVGLIPAAGTAERVSPLPCSKEIFPIGFGDIGAGGRQLPKAAAHYLLEKMCLAGASCAYIVLAKGKWDIPAYFGSGTMLDMALAYLVTELPYGVPFTLDSAVPFLVNKRVLFGFPDILFQPNDAYVQLLERMDAGRADVVLGLFPVDNPQKMDMVDLSADGAVTAIDIKPSQTHLKWTWIIAVWNGAFTQFMQDVVSRHLNIIANVQSGAFKANRREVFVGDVIREALGSGLKIDPVMFPRGTYIDIGSLEDMRAAVKNHALNPEAI